MSWTSPSSSRRCRSKGEGAIHSTLLLEDWRTGARTASLRRLRQQLLRGTKLGKRGRQPLLCGKMFCRRAFGGRCGRLLRTAARRALFRHCGGGTYCVGGAQDGLHTAHCSNPPHAGSQVVVAAAVAVASFTIRGAQQSQWSAGTVSNAGWGVRHGSANTTSHGSSPRVALAVWILSGVGICSLQLLHWCG